MNHCVSCADNVPVNDLSDMMKAAATDMGILMMLADTIHEKVKTAALMEGRGFEVAYVYNPSAFQVRDGRLAGAGIWLLRHYLYYMRCKKIAERLVRERSPDMVVADEDLAALAAAESKAAGIPRVLITDVLESRFAGGALCAVERRMNGAMRRMMDKCDAVIMPQGGADSGNRHMVGPIVRSVSESRDILRERFGMTGKTVLVTVGGTDAGRFLLDAMDEVAARLGDVADVVMLPGPALGSGVMHDMHERIMAADVVVSLAGRSTMDEAATYGTPGVFIPISGHFEREDNASRRGFSHGDVRRLHDIMLQKLDEPRRPSPADGARRAAGVIQSLI